jgi:PKD repeat protein/flagellar hook assembly protein FlgD
MSGNRILPLFAIGWLLASSAEAVVLNRAPDCSRATATPNRLWPANHELVSIEFAGITDPDGEEVAVTTRCIVQDEPLNATADGNTWLDGAGLDSDRPQVRAESAGNRDGRVYHVVFHAADSAGAACSGQVQVSVPHDEESPAVDSGSRYLSLEEGDNCAALPLNNPPLIYSEPLREAVAGDLYRYDVDGHDPDGDALLYSLVEPPQGMRIDAQDGIISWTPGGEQQGVHEIEVRVSDNGGLLGTQGFKLVVEAPPEQLSARIIANPDAGVAPLMVRFSAVVHNNNLVISKYQWDFDGDGRPDVTDTFGAPKSYTYSGAPGDSFAARLTVYPAGEEPITATRTISITNEPPSVQASADVTNGHAPLPVTFTVTAQDPQGIGELGIDFDGDGHFDEVQPGSTAGSWQFRTTYSEEGRYGARVRVVDAHGAEAVLSNHAISIDVNHPLDPVVQFTALPQAGDAPLTVDMTASATLYDASFIDHWSWDLDGDGLFETAGGSGQSDSAQSTYDGVGSYCPIVEVTTGSGRTARAALRIDTSSTARPGVVIPDSSDTIDAEAGESAMFRVNLPFATTLSLWLENADGMRVMTLLEAQRSEAGEYEFSWDGRNARGEILPTGDYYAVIAYLADGRMQEIDLRTSSGGQLSYYRRTRSNPRTFDRLESPLVVDYEVADPAEVTFFWQISWGQRLMTLLEHQRMGRGRYSLMWNGEYPGGEKVPDSERRLLPGILRYRLPDNVIFVKHEPRIESFELASTIVADPRREALGIEVVLSRQSALELVVADMQNGSNVATRFYPQLPAGVNNLSWDGKNNDGQLLAPGDYRVGVRSIDEQGSRSLFLYRSQRLQY